VRRAVVLRPFGCICSMSSQDTDLLYNLWILKLGVAILPCYDLRCHLTEDCIPCGSNLGHQEILLSDHCRESDIQNYRP
jgi:hypothetical protein